MGDPCSEASGCPAGGSGEPVCRTDWPGGYCAVEGCEEHGHDCPGDPGLSLSGGLSKCVLAPRPTCLKLCSGNGDCRPGHACRSRRDAAGHGSANVCVPE